MKVIDTDL